MVYIQELQSHPIYIDTLPTCLGNLSEIEQNDELMNSLSPYGKETLGRINGVLNHLKLRIDSIDPYLFRKETLDKLLQEVNQINSFLKPSTNLVNDSVLNNINSYLDSILLNMSNIPQISNTKELKGIREHVTAFRRSVAGYNASLEKLHKDIEEESNEITKEFMKLNDLFKDLEKKINDTLNNFEAQFVQLFNEMGQQQEQLLKNNEQVIQDTISTLKGEQESFKEITLQNKQEYDDILDEHKRTVESLLGIISTNTISGHFKEVADKKYSLTKTWQWLTGIGFAVTIVFGFYALIYNQNLDWPSLIARFIVTTALGSFTAYAARQVTKNEAQEKYNRQMEVELKTLNPYIASFSPEDQIKLKEQLFPHIFGRAETNNKGQEQNLNT